MHIILDISRNKFKSTKNIILAFNGRVLGLNSRVPAISKLVCEDILQMSQGASRAVRAWPASKCCFQMFKLGIGN